MYDDLSSNPTPPNASEEEAITANLTAHKDGIKSALATIGFLLIAPLFAFMLTSYFFQSYQVDGPSMQTTLQNNDRLLVVKVARTWSRLTHRSYLPNRGDIIVFNHPDATGTSSNERQLIKRVIGLPGERVVVKGGLLTVYNKENMKGFSPDETMSYGSVITTTEGEVDLVVPDGELFVCGDNRSNSLDSRYFGTVPVNDVVGKLGVRIYPFNQSQVF